jgi:hypothetical protein
MLEVMKMEFTKLRHSATRDVYLAELELDDQERMLTALAKLKETGVETSFTGAAMRLAYIALSKPIRNSIQNGIRNAQKQLQTEKVRRALYMEARLSPAKIDANLERIRQRLNKRLAEQEARAEKRKRLAPEEDLSDAKIVTEAEWNTAFPLPQRTFSALEKQTTLEALLQAAKSGALTQQTQFGTTPNSDMYSISDTSQVKQIRLASTSDYLQQSDIEILQNYRIYLVDTLPTEQHSETETFESEQIASAAATHSASEDAHSASEDAHSASEDAHSASEATHSESEDVHSGSEDAHSGSEDAHSGSEDAHSGSEDAHSASEDAHSGSEDAHSESEIIITRLIQSDIVCAKAYAAQNRCK